MSLHAAFLRGMNLGKRRVTNAELVGHLEEMGFEDVSAFLASGNLVFRAGRRSAKVLERELRAGLEERLAYAVPVFVRTAAEVRSLGSATPFSERELAATQRKLQVTLLEKAPTATASQAVLALATEDDRLALEGRALFWLPRAGVSDSELDFTAIGRALGETTTRTQRTLTRMASKFFAD